MALDRTDRRLLSALQLDGRMSVVELAESVGLSPTPCARRIRQLEQSGVIEGYAVLVNPVKLGLRVQAFVQVKLVRHHDDQVEQFSRALDGIEQVVGGYATTGEYDFILHVVAADLDSLSNVVLKRLLRIPAVRDVHSSIVLETVKRSVRVPIAALD